MLSLLKAAKFGQLFSCRIVHVLGKKVATTFQFNFYETSSMMNQLYRKRQEVQRGPGTAVQEHSGADTKTTKGLFGVPHGWTQAA